MRVLARFIGLLALAGAFAAALLDGVRWVAAGSLTPTSTGAAIYSLSPKTLAAVQAFVENRLGARAWDVVFHALLTPAFVTLTVLSAILFFLSRPRPPEIGYSSRDR